ncbi:MAG TPA: cyclic nucleotide-binding domain-containing protein [Levilinea sp.]|nr:cyclic nucleotide-binding domain-containing protein [Levilinea sp.]
MFRQDLAQLSIFQGFAPGQLELLAPMLKYERFHSGEVIFEQGKAASHLFILLTGEVVVRYKPYDGPPLIVTRIRPGSVFGWSAALMREIYSSGAEAKVESEAFQISNCQLRQFCEQYPETGTLLLSRLAEVIAERLKDTHTQIVTILSDGMDHANGCTDRDEDP